MRRGRWLERGITLVELCVIVVLSVLAVVVLLASVGGRMRGHDGARSVKDASQLRGIMQGMIVWSQNNHDDYPLPSKIDLKNTTTAQVGDAKNTSANIWSVMIYNGFLPVELMVSPAECNGNITPYTSYEYSSPHLAVDPAHALWDPGFPVDFTTGTGGTSYAHLMPTAARRHPWSNTLSASEVVISNRGPEIAGTTGSGLDITPVMARPDSNTLLIHGSRDAWEGHFGFNDNHVEFLTTMDWKGLEKPITFTAKDGSTKLDIPFYDEQDDPSGTNAYLGIFTKAGTEAGEFSAIWD